MKKTIAELAAKAITEHFCKDMKDPELRGDKFNEKTFNIERWVNIHLFMYYKTFGWKIKVPLRSREKAAILSRKIWNEFWNINVDAMRYDEKRDPRK